MSRIAPLLFLLAVPAFATPPDAPAPAAPAAPAIRLPELVDVPRPPSPAITKLSSAELYVVDSDVELRVIASPEGIVSITEEMGPMKVRAIFAGNLKPSTRTIKGPFIYSVEAVDTETPQTRRVELLITRTDPKVKTIIRRTLDVTSGAVPPLPPGPNPPGPTPPGPTPPIPPAPVPVTSFRVIFVAESATTLPLGLQAVMDAKIVRDYLNANTTKEGGYNGWRQYDPQSNAANETPTFKALWAVVKPQVTTVPCVVIVVNEKAVIEPFPATPADAIALFKKYNGGK
jgi:hypothetical protein